MPALQRKIIRDRTALPVVMKLYNNWIAELGNQLKNALNITAPLETIDAIKAQLKNNAQQQRLTILIFDQFEEFFFVGKKSGERSQFYQFLKDCLDAKDIPSVKVILSLREDYLHHLLEIERFTDIKFIDILSKERRYYLGNFSQKVAKKVITELSDRANFPMQPELIDQLVKDLSIDTDWGDVRPIELQIVGDQLYAENVTTVEELGDNSKETLAKNWLTTVVNDCGEENAEDAWRVLSSLTDDKGRRPLKTATELEESLQEFKKILGESRAKPTANRLSLEDILNILHQSGLLLRLHQEPEDVYQLVHDYLVDKIRQFYQVDLEKKLAESIEKNKKAEQKNRILVGGAIAVGVGLIAFLSVLNLFVHKRNINLDIANRTEVTKSLLNSNLQIEALIEALQIGDTLKHQHQKIALLNPLDVETDVQGVSVLRQVVYSVQEFNRLSNSDSSSAVYSISFSPDGKIIASGDRDGTLTLWNRDGKEIECFDPRAEDNRAHAGLISSISFSSDEKTIASSSDDGTVKLWHFNHNECKKERTLDGAVINHVTFSPDGKTIASAGDDNKVKLWNRDDGTFETLGTHEKLVWTVAFSPDGKTIASGSDDGTVKLWKLDGNQWTELRTLKRDNSDNSSVNRVAFSTDGKTIAAAHDDTTITLWNLDGTLQQTLKGHSDRVYSVAFSPDGKMLASAGGDRIIKLWKFDGKEWQETQTLAGHNDWIWNISFSPDGKTLASASDDNTVKLWNIRDGSLIDTLEGHQHWVFSVSFSPDGKTIASASNDGTVKLWNLDRDDLMEKGCNLLEDYLNRHPKENNDVQKVQKICKEIQSSPVK